MVTKTCFEEFSDIYGAYSVCNQGLEQTRASSGISFDSRNLATLVIQDELPEDTPAKLANKRVVTLDIQNTRNQGKIVETLGFGANSKKAQANAYVNAPGRLVRTLKGADKIHEGYVDNVLKLGLVKPKDAYTGSNSSTYTKISGLQSDIEDLTSKKQEEIPEIVSAEFKSDYDEGVEKDKNALKLINALRQIDGTLDLLKFRSMVDEKQEEFSTTLEGHEAEYLAANLKGEDFLEFYKGSLESIKQYQRELARQQSQRPTGA